MSIPLDHLWTVIAIDPVNGCHCQLLAAFPNDMPYLRMVKGFQTRTVKQINSFFRRFFREIFFGFAWDTFWPVNGQQVHPIHVSFAFFYHSNEVAH